MDKDKPPSVWFVLPHEKCLAQSMARAVAISDMFHSAEAQRCLRDVAADTGQIKLKKAA